MAIWRERRRKPIPADAEIIRRRGGKIARWQVNGRTLTAEVDGDSVVTEGRVYYARWRGADGLLRTASTGCRTADMAQRWLDSKTAEVERIKSGVVTAAEAATAEKSTGLIDDALAAFGADMKSRRRTAGHIKETVSFINRAATACGWRRLADMDGLQAGAWLRGLLDNGVSARTHNKGLVALSSFGRWCVKQRLILSNPFDSLSRMSEKVDRRYERRALTTQEVNAVVAAARMRPVIEALKSYKQATLSDDERARLEHKGWNRALCYRLMSVSGLRYGEARSLRLSDVHIGDTPHITIQAGREKARRGAQVPLHGAIVDEMESFVEKRKQTLTGDSTGAVLAFPGLMGAHLFDDLPLQVGKQFKGDCEAAGVETVDASGRVVDVHCLRYYFGSELARRGVPLHVVQKLMRHSTPTITSGVYVHSTLSDMGAAVDMLPDTGATATEKQAATGTVNAASDTMTQHMTETMIADVKTLQFPSSFGNMRDSGGHVAETCKTPETPLFTGDSGVKKMVNGAGLEPAATGLKVRCSTN